MTWQFVFDLKENCNIQPRARAAPLGRKMTTYQLSGGVTIINGDCGCGSLPADTQPTLLHLVWGLAATWRLVCSRQTNRVNCGNGSAVIAAPYYHYPDNYHYYCYYCKSAADLYVAQQGCLNPLVRAVCLCMFGVYIQRKTRPKRPKLKAQRHHLGTWPELRAL